MIKVGSYETLQGDPGLDGVSVLYLLVLTGRHVPLLAQPEAVVQPGQEVQTILHPGHVTQGATEKRLRVMHLTAFTSMNFT